MIARVPSQGTAETASAAGRRRAPRVEEIYESPGVTRPEQPSSALRVALVGMGAISRFYLAAIGASPRWELAAVCDVAEKRIAPWRGIVPCFSDQLTMLSELAGRLDAVIIAAPNDAHALLVTGALSAGVSVCVEKPLARTVGEGEFLAELARTTGACLFTAFHRRYNASVLDLVRDLAAGPAVRTLTVRYLERIEEHMMGDRWYLDPARCGGGCVADNGPNAFDLARLLLGSGRSDGDVTVRDVRISRDAAGVDRHAVIRLDGPGAAGESVDVTVELDWSYDGEIKDVTVELVDGRRLYADILAGHVGFKQSLWHEYSGIVAAFAAAIDAGPARWNQGPDGGLAALRLVGAAYRAEVSRAGAVE